MRSRKRLRSQASHSKKRSIATGMLTIPEREAEFLAPARACAPGGEAVEALQTSIQIGAVTKTLNVFGDRRYSGDQVS